MNKRHSQRNERKWRCVISGALLFVSIFVVTAFANVGPGAEEIETQESKTSEAQVVEETTEQQLIVEEIKTDQELEENVETSEEVSSADVTKVAESQVTSETTTETETTSAIETEPTEETAKIVWPEISSEDYKVLLKIVEAEATGNDVKAKMYVAAVVLNRVKSSKFPNTVKKVVYQRRQFTPVSDGRINCTPTKTTVEAVQRVLAGETDSDGALYFMNPNKSSKKNVNWFRSRLTYLFEYGGHEFYK